MSFVLQFWSETKNSSWVEFLKKPNWLLFSICRCSTPWDVKLNLRSFGFCLQRRGKPVMKLNRQRSGHVLWIAVHIWRSEYHLFLRTLWAVLFILAKSYTPKKTRSHTLIKTSRNKLRFSRREESNKTSGCWEKKSLKKLSAAPLSVEGIFAQNFRRLWSWVCLRTKLLSGWIFRNLLRRIGQQ